MQECNSDSKLWKLGKMVSSGRARSTSFTPELTRPDRILETEVNAKSAGYNVSAAGGFPLRFNDYTAAVKPHWLDFEIVSGLQRSLQAVMALKVAKCLVI